MKKQNNYTRFYALLKQVSGDAEIVKETLVSEHTDGRTTSLRAMSQHEYDAMCNALQAEVNHPGMTEEECRREMKRLRSAVLHRMQRLGVDTSDWKVVDTFCLNPRIAGKKFAQLTLAELERMIPKMVAISQKRHKPQSHEIVMPMIVRNDQIPS